MTDDKKNKISAMSLALIVFVIFSAGAGIFIVARVLLDDSPLKRSNVATVTLLKPPPPVIKEKPPEPEQVKEIPKQQEIVDPMPSPTDQPQNNDNDPTPAGDKLGLDADGQAGSDGFGLVGKKGGRSITAGGGGGLGRRSLLSQFGWYTHIVETEIRKKVMKHLDENGGIPKGKLQAIVHVNVNSAGEIVEYQIIGSSGNNRVDEAIRKSIGRIKISEPPPDGMPRKMSIKITSQG